MISSRNYKYGYMCETIMISLSWRQQGEVGGTVPKNNFILKLSAASGLPEYFFYMSDDLVVNSFIEAGEATTAWVVDLT